MLPEDKEMNDKVDVIILEADGKINQKDGYGFLIRKRLSEYKIQAEIISLVDNSNTLESLPPKPLILSGGMTEVTAEVDWVIETKEFIKKKIAFNQKTPLNETNPILGICFGAQLIAESYDKGSVHYLEDPEVGVSRIKLDISNHPLFTGFKPLFDVYTFHYNQIKSEKLLQISTADFKGNQFVQAFEIPETSIFGTQYHPEFKFNEMSQLLKIYKPLIYELGLDIEKIINTLPEIPHNAQILKNFVEISNS